MAGAPSPSVHTCGNVCTVRTNPLATIWPLVTKRTYGQLARASQSQLALQQQKIRDLQRELGEAKESQQIVAQAIGLHIERPYRENVIGGVTFPIHFSAYALREIGKRAERDELITQIVGDQVALEVSAMLADPTYTPTFRDALP
jgi:hypothetical protein